MELQKAKFNFFRRSGETVSGHFPDVLKELSDARILKNALGREDRLQIPRGKYYLVDGGFMLKSGIIVPYRSTRYHLKEYSARSPENAEELFNLRHASLYDEKSNKHDGTWTSIAFDNIVEVCAKKFGHVIDKENVKNQQRTLKTNFATCYDAFHDHSGFAWNPKSRLFEVEPEVWKEMLEDRAKGKGAVSAKEKSRQWQEENIDLTNSSIHVESPDTYVKPNSPTNASSQKNSDVSTKATVLKRKA
ncbi:UNVERIFIED_CONTAM: hypothetical protein Scaly_2536700 [Sesamum calycinum]|uniref:Myb/SANT-like domain-containing protein n=1 Tax=Sesamum calycinum TaxID=2727403 RepID=A0AAW2LVX9_9LAMI